MKEEEALVRALRVVRGSRNSKGVSLVAPIRFRGERGEKKPECPLYFLVRVVRVFRGS